MRASEPQRQRNGPLMPALDEDEPGPTGVDIRIILKLNRLMVIHPFVLHGSPPYYPSPKDMQRFGKAVALVSSFAQSR